VIYTSGSTGAPKGVMNEHRGLSNLVAAQAELFGVDASSRMLQFASPSFDASVSEIAVALTQGASLVLAEQADLMPGRPLLTLLARHRITHVTLPPAALPLCEDPELPFTPATLIVAGEAIRLSDANTWAARVETLINAYGPSETAVCATGHRCVPGASTVPIGRPIANARVYVLDARRQPVPIGMLGEIYIGGVPVGRGYLNRPELTADRFLPDPFGAESNARMYRTGDLGRFLPDGTLEFRGRADHQIKLRGFRIELDEITAHLSSLEGVSNVLVIAREDSPGDKRLVAYYCGAAAPAPHALRAHAVEALPDYMVPAAFVRLDALPITANGKVDRDALPLPDRPAAATAAYQPPAGALEVAIARIWAEVLGVELIGRHDDFFHLGGHSLKAVEVLSRLHRELGRTPPLRDLFAHTTLSQFAAAIERAGANRAPSTNLICLRSYGRSRPLFAVHPLGGTIEYLRLLAPHLDPQLPLYGLAASGWDGNEAPPTSIPEIAARYVDALRVVQPNGPYRLLGYSVGGVIAYAMAEALIERGELVEFLGIIDTHPDLGGLSEFRALIERIERAEVEQGAVAADRLFLQHVIQYLVPAHAVSAVEQSLHEESSTLLDLDHLHVKVSGQPELLRNALRTMRATTRALCEYRPSPLPLHVDLFVASEEVMFDLPAAWSELMPRQVRAVPIPGSHLSMMEPRNIGALAFAITAGLAQARPIRIPLRVRDSIRDSSYAAAQS
jgi:thioesterase domain-containing protein/acyl carrier protein